MITTLSSSIASFLHNCRFERKLSLHTCRAYRFDLKGFERFIQRTAENVSIAEINRAHFSDYLKILDNHKPTTIRRKLATLKSLFSYLERESLLSQNPVKSFRLKVRVGRRLPKSVSLDAIRTLLTYIRSQIREDISNARETELIRDLAVFEMLFASGMRVGELSNLRTGAIDLKSERVLIYGKGSRERVVPLCSKPVRLAVARYLQRAHRTTGDAFLFLNRRGKRLTEQSIRTSLRRYAAEAGLGKVTPHMIRHTLASLLLARGADLRNIQILLGHSSITTTTIYTHVDDTRQRDVLSAFHPRNLF
jgi:integrase/recombinase XerD